MDSTYEWLDRLNGLQYVSKNKWISKKGSVKPVVGGHNEMFTAAIFKMFLLTGRWETLSKHVGKVWNTMKTWGDKFKMGFDFCVFLLRFYRCVKMRFYRCLILSLWCCYQNQNCSSIKLRQKGCKLSSILFLF